MFGKFRNWLSSIQEGRRFARRSPAWRQAVFYSEGGSYSKYLCPLLAELVSSEGLSVAYLTSDVQDPILSTHNNRIDTFYIGRGGIRTWVFQTLEAAILVTTTPDLQTLHLKRSSVYPVHYVYLHHSLVSTHRIYRTGAFDYFDSVLCAGPHHEREIREWEAVNRLPAKRLFRHGYAPLDFLLNARRDNVLQTNSSTGLNVLLAPSWGPEGLLERGAAPIVQALISAGHSVLVRPHPMTTRLSGNMLRSLAARFRRHPRFCIDTDITSMQALLNAHVMVSDWSGVAMEFAFGLHRPVLFIDVAPKVNNPRWADISSPPLEVVYRSEVGALLGAERLHTIADAVETLWQNRKSYAVRAEALMSKCVYNPGESSKVGAHIIAGLVREYDQG